MRRMFERLTLLRRAVVAEGTSMAFRRSGATGWRPVALGLLAVFATAAQAQISEADRLARCQNNRDALARLQQSIAGDWNDDQWARVRAAARAISQADRDIRHVERVVATVALSGHWGSYRAIEEARKRKLDAASAIGLTCPPHSACEYNMGSTLNAMIERAEPRRQQVLDIRRQMAIHQTNLVALQCDRPSTGYALADPYGSRWSESENGWSGDWVRRGKSNVFDASWGGGSVRAVLTMSISGNQVSVSRQGATDGNNCQYQGTLDGYQASGTYRCTSGGGNWRATIH